MRAGHSIVDAVNLYLFDKKLRLIALDALERIAVALRADIAYLLGQRRPFADLNAARASGYWPTGLHLISVEPPQEKFVA